jgi:hypothetical protein
MLCPYSAPMVFFGFNLPQSPQWIFQDRPLVVVRFSRDASTSMTSLKRTKLVSSFAGTADRRSMAPETRSLLRHSGQLTGRGRGKKRLASGLPSRLSVIFSVIRDCTRRGVL